MLTFIVSVIVVTIISLCFFKKNFWENRYLILLICGGVAFFATLTINLSVREHLPTKSVVIDKTPLYKFYVQDSLLMEKTFDYCDYYNYFNDCNTNEFKYKKDSLHEQVELHLIFYMQKIKSSKTLMIGVFDDKTSECNYEFGDVYIAPSADTTAYIIKKKLVYDIKSKWISEIGLPRVSTIRVIYIPKNEYKVIPDSLIRKIPY